MQHRNPVKKRCVFTVTNDLNFDQRMIRICSSLQRGGYSVLLVGRRQRKSRPLTEQVFQQKRLFCFFEKGKLFYIEYNFRLFIFLLFQKMDLVCAIDLDTILPCYFSSVLKRCKRVYDAHELFCEMKEIVTRPRIYKVWKGVERFAVPRFRAGYTVSPPIQAIFEKEYGVKYGLIMNVPLLRELPKAATENFILYQGAVNEGRSFETLIPAFQWVPVPFHIYGDGNFMQACESLIQQYGLQQKVFLKGKLLPADLRQLTGKALFGITLFENNGLSNYYSLANRFFDYIHAGVPQLCVKYPAYTHINHSFPVAALVDDLSPTALAEAINALLSRPEQLQAMRIACQQARQVYNWQAEEKKLLGLYKTIWHG